MALTTNIPLYSRRVRDQLGNADVERVSTMTFAIIDAIAKHDDRTPLPGEMVGAVSAAFVLIMEACKLPAYDAAMYARNIMSDADGRRPEFKAITDYIKKEVLT